MTPTGNELQKNVSDKLNTEKQPRTNLNSRHSLLQRLSSGRGVRARFVESHISKSIAFQIRALREREGWSQQTLAEKIGSNQNAIYRAENPNYGKQTITTLKKIAAEFDVALVVRFVPFSELIDWASGTPRVNDGLNSEALDVPSFDAEEKARKFNDGLLPCPKEELDLRKPVMSAAEKRFKKPIQELRDAIHTAIVKFEDENRLAEVTHIDLKRDAPSSRKLEILAHVVSTPR